MPKLLRILRDPIWQFIGSALALLAILLPLLHATKSDGVGKLVVAPHSDLMPFTYSAFSNSAESSLKVLIDGMQIPSKQLVIATYYIWNRGQSITPDQYFEKLKVLPIDNVEVLLVKRVADQKIKNEDWIRDSSGTFVFQNQLLNPDDSMFYQFVLWVKDEKLIKDHDQLKDLKLIDFSGKIKNVQIKVYSDTKSVLEGEANLQTAIRAGMRGIGTFLDGYSIVGLFAIASFLVFAQTLAMQAVGILPKLPYKVTSLVILMLLLSIISSEITVDVLFNDRKQHPIIYPLIFIHACFLLFLGKKLYDKYRPLKL